MIRMITTGVSALLVLFGILVSAIAADPSLQPVADPRPILEDLQAKMTSVKSVYFELVQERHLQLFVEPLKSEGVMLIERPDKIRWEITAPYQSILVANQKSVAQFERQDGQWKKLRLGFPQQLRQVMEQMVRMHQGRLDALTSDYSISVATGKVAVVTLVPRNPDVRSMLASIDVRMAPDFSATREVVMNEPTGERTRIVFQREVRNVPFPPATFDQTRPLDLGAIKAVLENGR